MTAPYCQSKINSRIFRTFTVIFAVSDIKHLMHLYNIFPNNHATQHPLWPRENRYSKPISSYKEIVDFGCGIQKKRGLKDSSIERAKAEATAFLYSLQEKGIYSLADATEDDVISANIAVAWPCFCGDHGDFILISLPSRSLMRLPHSKERNSAR